MGAPVSDVLTAFPRGGPAPYVKVLDVKSPVTDRKLKSEVASRLTEIN